MDSDPICPRCGCEVPEHETPGLCARCLREDESSGSKEPSEPEATVLLGDEGGEDGSEAETLAGTIGDGPGVLLRDKVSSGSSESVVCHDSDETAIPGERSVRLTLVGEIARGGMGAILKGRDEDLGRDLAVKVLLESHRGKPVLVRRFIEEARIAGQLQHPGVAPIYEMGTFTDGRPYFTMKLVKGQTLAELLKSRSDSGDGLPRLLGIFEQMCQTVAYAHARGVIHRDLKPSNVMVGLFGEVQVMDWGLAKVLNRGGAVEDASVGVVSGEEEEEGSFSEGRGEGDTELSKAGSVLGTPAYMAPEQARGEVDQVDERADVFALGSILCEMLTGVPAFTGRNVREIQKKAARGKVEEALERLNAAEVDGELKALASDCLAVEASDRPGDARALVDRFSAYMTGVQERLRAAEVARGAAAARAEEAQRTAGAERRARRMTAALAVSIIGLIAVGAGGYLWSQGQREQRRARLAGSVEEALGEAIQFRLEAEADSTSGSGKWSEALSAAKRAENLLRQDRLDSELHQRVAIVLGQIRQERERAQAEARRLEVDQVLRAELELIRGNQEEGNAGLRRTDLDYAAAFRKAGLDLARMTPKEVERWASGRSQPVELATYLDDWASVKRRESGTGFDEWKTIVAAARAADPNPWRNALRSLQGSTGEAARRELRRLAEDTGELDGQPPESLVLLARELNYVGEAEGRSRAAEVLRRAVVRHPGDFWVHMELARIPGVSAEEAARHLTAATAIRPESAMAHRRLAERFRGLGRREEAVEEFREVLRLQPDSSWAQLQLCHTLEAMGLLDEEIEAYRDWVEQEPEDAWAHARLGVALKVRKDYDAAIEEFQKAIELRPEMVLGYVELGGALWQLGRRSEAAVPWKEAVRLNPDDWLMQYNLGSALRSAGYPHGAIVAYREACRLDPGRAGSWEALAEVQRMAGDLTGAIASYRQLTRLRPDDPNVYYQLGLVQDEAGDLEGALASQREAMRLDGSHVGYARFEVARLLKRLGRTEEMLSESRRAVELEPGNRLAHVYLGLALRDSGDLAGAVEEYRKAALLDPVQLSILDERIVSLLISGNFSVGLAVFRIVIRRQYGSEQTLELCRRLGYVLVQEGRWSDALAVLTLAAEEHPDNSMIALEATSLFVKTGDDAGYRRHCEAMLDQFADTTDVNVAEQTAKSCLLSQRPAGDRERRDRLVEFVMEAMPGGSSPSWHRLIAGLAEYRAGRFDRAMAWLGDARWGNSLRGITARLILALAEQRAGYTDRARDRLERASWVFRTVDIENQKIREWHDWLICEYLLHEAEATILYDPIFPADPFAPGLETNGPGAGTVDR